MKVLFKTTLCDFSGYVSAYEIFIKASNSFACFHFAFALAGLRSGGPELPRGGKGSGKEGGKGG